MNDKGKQVLIWLPRVLAIVFTLFLGLFALDVFGEGYGFWEAVGAFLIHLIPNFILIGVIILAWKRPWTGAIFFVLLAVAYMVMVRGNQMHWTTFLVIPLPMMVVSLLYWLSWQKSKQVEAG